MTRKRQEPYDAALDVLQRLRANGHEALFAGGCVRDRLLRQSPKDFDIATNARPDQVIAIFPSARQVGAKFGVVLVRRFGHDTEVATFRTDGDYVDGRHPADVTFGTAENDAKRRDFTINGLFFDPIEQRVIDFVGGQADLQARVLRTIGEPTQRFGEDHLRMLRAVRFAARLAFSIDVGTFAAMQQHASKLPRISAERIWNELSVILAAPTRGVGWGLLLDSGLRPHLCKAWPASDEQDRLTSKRLAALPDLVIDPTLALAACMPNRPRVVCQALRLSNRQMETVVWLLSSFPLAARHENLDLADLKQLVSASAWDNLLLLLEADMIAKGEGSDGLQSLRRRVDAIAPEQVAPPPLLTGNDLLAVGVRPGPKFGMIIDAVYHAQRNEEISTKDEALAFVRRIARD